MNQRPSVAILIACNGFFLSIVPAYDFVKLALTSKVLRLGSHMAQAVIWAVIHARGIATIPGVHTITWFLH